VSGHLIRRASVDDAAEAGDVLAAAFAADPNMLWMAHHPRDPTARFRPFFTADVRLATRRDGHDVFVLEADGRIEGVAVWTGIDEWKTSLSDNIRLTPAALRTFRFPLRAMRIQAAVERAHPSAPHFFLAVFGVHTRARGRGYGSAMLRDMTGRLDEQGIDAYLESSNPRNESIYRRHGFEVSGEITVPQGAPPLVPMWRPTRNP